jgi:hypothetical protein
MDHFDVGQSTIKAGFEAGGGKSATLNKNPLWKVRSKGTRTTLVLRTTIKHRPSAEP